MRRVLFLYVAWFVTLFLSSPYCKGEIINHEHEETDVLNTTLAYGFPVIVITTENGDMPTVDLVSPPPGAMGSGVTNATKVPGSVERYETNGTCSFSSGEYVKKQSGMTVKIRGNSSAQWVRKPYKIKLQKKSDLMNRGDAALADKNWALLTAGAWRNWMALKLASTVTRGWSPDCEWVNVIFNGRYHGLYLLSETIERNNKARINVADDGFIVEKDPYWWTEDGEYLMSVLNPAYNYTMKFPDFEALDASASDYIQSTLDPLLTIVSKGDYSDYLDVDSWVDFVLMHDFLGTNDAGGCNLYFTRYDRNAKIGLGPAWDFDTASQCVGWSATHKSESYISQLFANPDRSFVRKYVERYDEISEAVFSMLERMIQNGPCDEDKFLKPKDATDQLVSNNILSHTTARETLGKWLPSHRLALDSCVRNLRETFSSVSKSRHTILDVECSDGYIHVSGMEPGESLQVYSIDGRRVFEGNADSDGSIISEKQLHHGILIILTGSGVTTKIMI